jgi:hypothetical protein
VSTGSLMFPIGYVPLDDNGNPVPSGKLAFSRTGTSTAQDTYSDSTLDTANANPVVLSAAGRLTTKVYGNPASGYDYRVRLLTSADVEVWSFDDVVVDGADTATYTEGSFTGTITGVDAVVTGTVNYRIFADSTGTGKLCQLYTTASISGTSNTTAFTMTGLPSACQTTATTYGNMFVATDNSATVQANAHVNIGTVTFFTDDPLSATGWTNSGTKGLLAGWSMTYPIR